MLPLHCINIIACKKSVRRVATLAFHRAIAAFVGVAAGLKGRDCDHILLAQLRLGHFLGGRD